MAETAITKCQAVKSKSMESKPMKSFLIHKSDSSKEIVKAERVEAKVPLLGKVKVAKFFTGKKLVKTVKGFTVLIEVSPDIELAENQFSDDE